MCHLKMLGERINIFSAKTWVHFHYWLNHFFVLVVTTHVDQNFQSCDEIKSLYPPTCTMSF